MADDVGLMETNGDPMILENSVLEYLHDADLNRISIEFLPNERRLTFTATFHPDCGLSALNGKTIEVVASDISLITCSFIGCSLGQESIDRCNLEISEKARDLLQPYLRAGFGEPKTGLSLLTHAGSEIEVLCRSLAINTISD